MEAALPVRLAFQVAVSVLLLLGGSGAAANGHVVDLNDDTFEHETQAATGQTTGDWVVFFHASASKQSTRYVPIFESFGAAIAGHNARTGANVICAQVDTTKNAALQRRFNLTTFPTIRIFRRRQMEHYYTWMHESKRTAGAASGAHDHHDPAHVGVDTMVGFFAAGGTAHCEDACKVPALETAVQMLMREAGVAAQGLWAKRGQYWAQVKQPLQMAGLLALMMLAKFAGRSSSKQGLSHKRKPEEPEKKKKKAA